MPACGVELPPWSCRLPAACQCGCLMRGWRCCRAAAGWIYTPWVYASSDTWDGCLAGRLSCHAAT
eukprot:15431180-Alexandrium_andersonii.AAC.1